MSESQIETSDVLPPAPPPMVDETGAHEIDMGEWWISDRSTNPVPYTSIVLCTHAAHVVDTAVGTENTRF